MEYEIITAVGIDVSKEKSMVAVRRPGGEVVLTPFQGKHDVAGLSGLVKTLRDVGGEIRIVADQEAAAPAFAPMYTPTIEEEARAEAEEFYRRCLMEKKQEATSSASPSDTGSGTEKMA